MCPFKDEANIWRTTCIASSAGSHPWPGADTARRHSLCLVLHMRSLLSGDGSRKRKDVWTDILWVQTGDTNSLRRLAAQNQFLRGWAMASCNCTRPDLKARAAMRRRTLYSHCKLPFLCLPFHLFNPKNNHATYMFLFYICAAQAQQVGRLLALAARMALQEGCSNRGTQSCYHGSGGAIGVAGRRTLKGPPP